MKTILCAALAAVSTLVASANDLAEIKAKVAKEHSITAVDKFYGFDRVVFDFKGYEAWVVCPSGESREGKPWTWTMQWSTAFVPRTNVPQMLADGYHHVTLNTFVRRMDAEGLEVSAAFQKFLVENLGLAPKAYLIGMSWGGFFSVRYANRYPENVAKIYLDAPLLCFKDFRIGIGPWEDKMPEGGWATSSEMPVNMAESIAKAEIPVLVLYGGEDPVVPPASNCEPFVERVKAAGGEIEVVKRGLYAHHPHGVEVNESTIKAFFERPKRVSVADFPGEASAMAGARLVYPKVKLDKTADENAFYFLSFQAKAEVDGYWWVDMEDAAGSPLPDVNSRLYKSDDWQRYEVLVPTHPEAVAASIAFVVKNGVTVRNVRMRRASVGEACDWVRKTYAEVPKLNVDVPVSVWDKLPNSRVAIKVAKDFNIVFLGDSIMNDTWCGGFDALVRQEYSDTNFRSYPSVRGSTGCWFYRDAKNFEQSVARFKPNLVVIGGVSNLKEGVSPAEAEEALVETINRCKALGAEVVVATPAKSCEFRADAAAKPFDAALCGPDGKVWLRSDYEERACARTNTQLWDMTSVPCEAISQSGKPLGWFNRDAVHSDNRGKALNAMMMFYFFNAAQK